MTVYELIQKLSSYSADTEVRFHFKGSFDTDVEAEFDRDNADDTQEVTVAADFDDNLDYDGICDYESSRSRGGSRKPHIAIELKY